MSMRNLVSLNAAEEGKDVFAIGEVLGGPKVGIALCEDPREGELFDVSQPGFPASPSVLAAPGKLDRPITIQATRC